MRLRPGVPEDARRIAEIHVQAWKTAYPGLVPQDYLDALRPEDRVAMWDEALASDEPWPAVVVAEDDAVVAGFCCFGRSSDDDDGAPGRGEVYTVYVDPPSWGDGVGRALLEAAATGLESGGFDVATLWVLGINGRARGFYEHLGWEPDGATKEHDWGDFVATDVRYRKPLA